MKALFPLFFLFGSLFFSSCSWYARVVTLRTNAPEMDTMKLLYANDSFSIVYDFYGAGCVMRMKIFNKLDMPLAINWAQSSYVIGNQSISYVSTYGWHNDSIYNKEQQVSSLPPHSFLQKAVTISNQVNFITRPLTTNYRRKKMTPGAGPKDSFSISESDYNRSNSPFVFRNYLTLSYDPAFIKAIHLDHTFWVASIMDMSSGDFFGTYTDENGNSKSTSPFFNNNCFFYIYQKDQ